MEESKPMCPRCELDLTPIRGENGLICPGCGEFIMPLDSFKGIVGLDVSEEVQRPGPDHQMLCPSCQKHMPKAEVHGVEVDVCRTCNVMHSGRASMQRIMEASGHAEAVDQAILEMDIARNTDNLCRCHIVKNLGVDDIFLMFKNGILVTSYTTDVHEDLDQDVLGSMLMAITQFIQSCFKSVDSEPLLSSIRLKEKEIAFEHGEFLVLAISNKETIDDGVKEHLSGILTRIEKNNKDTLANWDGALKGLTGVVSEFDRCLSGQC